MMSPDEAPRVIAANVRRLRRERGWKQEEAAEALHAAGGPLWSKATWSALETSANGERVRAFSAAEVAYLAVTFEVPVGDLYAPPPPEPVPCPHCDGTGWVTPDPEPQPYYGSSPSTANPDSGQSDASGKGQGQWVNAHPFRTIATEARGPARDAGGRE